MIKITSRKEGFMRCGVAHSAGITEWPDDRFTADELARLQAEPILIVLVEPDEPVTSKSATK